MNKAEKKRSPRVRNLIAFSMLILLLFFLSVAYQASQEYGRAVDKAKKDGTRLTRIMSQQIALTILGADNTLRRAVEHQYFNELFGRTLPQDMLGNMQMWVRESPSIVSMMQVDEHGQPALVAHQPSDKQRFAYEKASFADNALFKAVQDGNDNEYFIGTGLGSNAAPGQNLILIGRKITRIDGSFGGALIAAIEPDTFLKYFTSVEQGTKSYIALQSLGSGAVLTEESSDEDTHAAINRAVMERLRASAAPAPGVEQIVQNHHVVICAYQVVPALPIAVTVALDEDDYLKEWRQSSWKDVGFLTIFSVFSLAVCLFARAMESQIKRVEQSEAAAVLASQAKSEFLANMSHELRTPLNAIIGFSEMMNSGYFGPLNPKQKDRVSDINICGSHLLQLITDILEFSKGDAGKLELIEEKVSMRELVSETLRIMNERIKLKRMNILIEVESGLPVMLGDKRKIRQILLNLVSNSLKFTPEDGTIKVAVKLDMAGNMTLTVSDTGIGIAEEDIPIALSVFGQVHRSQSHEGTGLGLPLCKMFAELHGAKLALGSTLGEGTTVRITFPSFRNLPSESDEVAA